MKIQIELTRAQVRGIREYLESVSPDIDPKITKEDIVREIGGMVSGELQNGCIYDYIKKYENQ